MASPPFLAPQFGDSLPIEASPQTLAFLGRRRSASAVTLAQPGPTPCEIHDLLTLAARAPDHGKLAPWRFIVLRDEAKEAYVKELEAVAASRPDAGKATAKLMKMRVPPVSVAVVSRPVSSDIPEWEQLLSAGAVCTILIIAAQAMGYGANWITDWYAYDGDATNRLGLAEGERVAGFVQLGTPADAPLERVRPDLDSLVTTWRPDLSTAPIGVDALVRNP